MHDGHYEFPVMPFGLCNALSTFQSMMNATFWDQLLKSILIFFDDILIYNLDRLSHLQHLHLALAMLVKHFLVTNREKCEFTLQTISYLGHTISHLGVGVDNDKITAITA